MNEELKQIKDLCSQLYEGKVEILIGNEKYNFKPEDIISFAQQYEKSIIRLKDALNIIKNLNLHSDLKRVVIDKGDKFTNKTDYDKVKRSYTIPKS